MKKIAFVIQMFQDKNFHGGGEKLFCKLISEFIKDNHIVDIYCSKSNVLKFTGINKIVIVNKPYNHLDPKIMETFYGEVKKLTGSERYDYIISENITPPIDITFLQGHSLVYRQRKLKNFLESFLYRFRPVKIRRIKYQKKWLKQGYRKIFAVSDILKNDILDNFNIPEEKISVVYPGVDIPEHRSSHTVIDEEQGSLSLVEAFCNMKNKNYNDPLIFGLSAPGFKIKGGFVFLKALKLLKQRGLKFRAKIIYPKFKKNLGVKILLKLYGIEKNVEFIDYQEDMQDFYSRIDCIVIPSIEDCFNLVALEAMANRKPCIISSNAGASEIIRDGANGFVFKMDKRAARNLASKMAFIINNIDKIPEYSAKAYKTAKLFSWSKVYKAFISELNKL